MNESTIFFSHRFGINMNISITNPSLDYARAHPTRLVTDKHYYFGWFINTGIGYWMQVIIILAKILFKIHEIKKLLIRWLFDFNHKVKPSIFVVVCCLKKLHSSHKSGTQSMTGFKMSILSVHHRFYALCPLVLFPLFTWLVLLILTIWLMMPDESSVVLFPFHTVLENHGWNRLQHAYFGIKLLHRCN